MNAVLCRQCVSERAQAGALPLTPPAVGSHGSRSVQIDIVAINWLSHTRPLGACKEVDRQGVRELIEQKAPKLPQDLPGKGEGWTVHHAVFARRGFTAEARTEAGRRGAVLVDAEQLESALR